MGKVLPVGGIPQKIRAAYEAGVKEVILPADNIHEAQTMPGYILEAVRLTPVTHIDEVLKVALVQDGAV
jgi:ATP-dependent Lon protease